MAQVVINQEGPLPIEVEMQSGDTGTMMLILAGSAWSQVADVPLGVEVLLDGVVVGSARIFSNGTSEHRALVPAHIPVVLDKPFSGDDPPSYTVALQASNPQTITDVNDYFQVTLSG